MKKQGVTAFLTWDLERNIEDRSAEFNEDVQHVALGVESIYNFGIGMKYVYDLEYALPLNFYQVKQSIIPSRIERVVSTNQDYLLLKF